MEKILPFLVFIGFVAVFVVIWFASMRQVARARQNLGLLAQGLGLPAPVQKQGFLARFAPPTLGGDVRGRHLRVYNYSTGSGKNRTTWCALALAVRNPGNLTLRVSRENMFTRAGRIFGVDDVATGDASFDKEFYVKSNDPAYVHAAFLPEVRSQISQAWNQGARGTMRIEGGEIKYAETGSFSSRKVCDRWPAMIELAFLLADVVEARSA